MTELGSIQKMGLNSDFFNFRINQTKSTVFIMSDGNEYNYIHIVLGVVFISILVFACIKTLIGLSQVVIGIALHCLADFFKLISVLFCYMGKIIASQHAENDDSNDIDHLDD